MARTVKSPRSAAEVLGAMQAALEAWNALTDAQRRALMASRKGASPAEIMRALGHDIPVKFELCDEAQAQLALVAVKAA